MQVVPDVLYIVFHCRCIESWYFLGDGMDVKKGAGQRFGVDKCSEEKICGILKQGKDLESWYCISMPLSHCTPSQCSPIPLQPCRIMPPSLLNHNLPCDGGTMGRGQKRTGAQQDRKGWDGDTIRLGHNGTWAQWADPGELTHVRWLCEQRQG